MVSNTFREAHTSTALRGARGGEVIITPSVKDTIEHHCKLNFGVKYHSPRNLQMTFDLDLNSENRNDHGKKFL